MYEWKESITRDRVPWRASEQVGGLYDTQAELQGEGTWMVPVPSVLVKLLPKPTLKSGEAAFATAPRAGVRRLPWA